MAVICPREFRIFWFDSIKGGSIDQDHKKVFELLVSFISSNHILRDNITLNFRLNAIIFHGFRGILRWHDAQNTDALTLERNPIRTHNIKV